MFNFYGMIHETRTTSMLFNAMSLLLNYLKSALRNIARLRVHAVVNITGLTVGFAGFIIIMLYVNDELAYDRYHTHAEEIVRVKSTSDFEGVAERSASCPAPLGPVMLQEYPHLIANMTRVYNEWSTEYYIEYGEKAFREKRFYFVDSTFSDVFDLEFLRGNPQDALSKPFTTLITKSAAERYFGDEDPVDKTIKFEGQINILITGVVADTPPQSHFSYDFLASMSTLRMLWGGRMPETWVYNPFWTYLRLHSKDNASMLEAQLPAFTQKYFYDAEKDHISLGLQPLTEIHLRSGLDYELELTGKISYIRILLIVATLILVIASINYINLSTAFAIRRSRETAIRKVAGASKTQLIVQHLGESLLMTLIALILALAVIEIALPFFNRFAGKAISSFLIYKVSFLPKLLLLWLGTGLLSGVYPAFFQTGFKTLQVLKGRSAPLGSGFGRKVLVVVQFSLSIALITSGMMAFEQISYLRSAELGFRKENIIMVPVMRSPVVQHFETFRDELSASPDIEGVTAVDYIIGTDHNNHEFRPEGYPEDKWQFYPALVVRDDFCRVFDIKLVAGRDFITGSETDPMEAILINEAMVKHLGWKSNEEALGKRFHSRAGKEKVTGVFQNFNASSLHAKAGPLVLNVKEAPWEVAAFTNFVAVRAAKGKMPEAISHIEKTWGNFAPGRPFSYTILNRELDKLYNGEEYLGQVTAVLAVLTILVAAIGLFGLVSFMAAQKMHEIGVRKVLGASTADLIMLLTSTYLRLVILSILIAWPLSYLLINRWFGHFAYHTEMKWEYFILAGGLSLLLTASITIIKAWKSSGVNPAITLKYE